MKFYWLKIARQDFVDWFECARCHARTDSEDGGDVSAVDPCGNMCSACWCERDAMLPSVRAVDNLRAVRA